MIAFNVTTSRTHFNFTIIAYYETANVIEKGTCIKMKSKTTGYKR
jgi:hypothetical protein